MPNWRRGEGKGDCVVVEARENVGQGSMGGHGGGYSGDGNAITKAAEARMRSS
jgi:hypothetical protein